MAGPAQRQNRGAADHIYGHLVHQKGVIGFSCKSVYLSSCENGIK